MFTFLYLQENLLYIQSQKPIAPDLIYYIMSANSVFIRSTYSLDVNTLLVDLSVPTGELEFDLASDIIGACQKYVWTYKDDTYILETSKANGLLQDPRIIQDYSCYLVEGYMQEVLFKPISYYLTFIIWLQWKVYILLLCNFWEIVNCVSAKLFSYYMHVLSQLEHRDILNIEPKKG